jgi:hypothetical protein
MLTDVFHTVDGSAKNVLVINIYKFGNINKGSLS